MAYVSLITNDNKKSLVDIWQSKHPRWIRSHKARMEINEIPTFSRIFEKYFTLNLFRYNNLFSFAISQLTIFSIGDHDEKIANTRLRLHKASFLRAWCYKHDACHDDGFLITIGNLSKLFGSLFHHAPKWKYQYFSMRCPCSRKLLTHRKSELYDLNHMHSQLYKADMK